MVHQNLGKEIDELNMKGLLSLGYTRITKTDCTGNLVKILSIMHPHSWLKTLVFSMYESIMFYLENFYDDLNLTHFY